MSYVKVGEMTIEKNESGYTLFIGPIILSDAPYERLNTDPTYKQEFIRTLRESMALVDEEDRTKLKRWLEEVKGDEEN